MMTLDVAKRPHADDFGLYCLFNHPVLICQLSVHVHAHACVPYDLKYSC